MSTFFYIFLVVAIIVMIIHCYSVNDSLEDVNFLDYLVNDGGFLVLLGLVVLGAIIFGFIFWNWVIMLIITISIVLVGIGVIVYFSQKDKKADKEIQKRKNYTENMLTNCKCKNCGASLIKNKTVKNGKRNIVYVCSHCGVSYDENEVKLDENIDKHNCVNKYDLTDFEEEYFNSCFILGIKPYGEISETTIERKKNKRINQLIDKYGVEDEYDLNTESLEYVELIDSYDYLCDIEDELETYKEENDVDEIKDKYDYYLETYLRNTNM